MGKVERSWTSTLELGKVISAPVYMDTVVELCCSSGDPAHLTTSPSSILLGSLSEFPWNEQQATAHRQGQSNHEKGKNSGRKINKR